MNKFATGLITGGILGAAGLTWALSDRKTRRKMAKNTSKAMDKANHMFGNMTHMF